MKPREMAHSGAEVARDLRPVSSKGSRFSRTSPPTTCHGDEGVLVLVSKGLGALRWQLVKAEGVTKQALMLRDTPLLFAQSDEYWCPTCEKLLALGWGRDQVDDETLALVMFASDVGVL